jgi:hypothetical protein
MDMETMSSMGGLIPLWILGAGLLAGVVDLMRTPAPRHRHDSERRPLAADARVPHTGAYQPGRTVP